jgi:hypothetical protein
MSRHCPATGRAAATSTARASFWGSLASGHLASFDRSKCKVLNGPTATGKHCREGWTPYPFPGPQFKNIYDPGSAESSYCVWVDQHNTLGLGQDVPIATGNLNSALLALVGRRFVVLRVPYVNDYFTKGMDGRIDDPNAGWKGRALWTTYATRAMFHLETGKRTFPKVVSCGGGQKSSRGHVGSAASNRSAIAAVQEKVPPPTVRR